MSLSTKTSLADYKNVTFDQKKPIKIFVAHSPGFFNRGDAAIILGTIRTLKTFVNAEISLISYSPKFDRTQCSEAKIIPVRSFMSERDSPTLNKIIYLFYLTWYVFLVFVLRVLRLDWSCIEKTLNKELWNSYTRSDAIIVGLDDSLTTLFGFSSIIIDLYVIFLAKFLKKPVIIYAASIGPLPGNRVFTSIITQFLNKVDMKLLREELSYQYIQKMGVRTDSVYVTADLGFILPCAPKNRVREIMVVEGIVKNNRPLIGLSLSQRIARWAFPEAVAFKEKYEGYIEIMAQLAEYLVDELNATIIFIPHCMGPYKVNDDTLVFKHIYHRAKKKVRCYMKTLTHLYSPEELKGLIAQCDLFIGARTHSVINAATMNIPFIAITYSSHKTRGIIGNMLSQGQLVYDIRILDFRTLRSKVEEVWLRREEIKKILPSLVEPTIERAWSSGELIARLLRHKDNKDTKN
jgi:polysaccharide pyruvyl transferase WcaK-like protein